MKKTVVRLANPLVILFFLAAFLQVTVGIAEILTRIMLVDFKVYFDAAQVFFVGRNPYLLLYNRIPINYPPSTFLVFAPLLLLPARLSQWVLTALSFVCAGLVVFLLAATVSVFRSWQAKLILAALLFQFFPTKFTLVMGQINLIVLFCLTVSFLASRNRKDIASGLWLALAVLLKVTPVSAGLYFFARGRYKLLAVAAGTVAVVMLVLFLTYPQATSYFLSRQLPSLLFLSEKPAPYDQSLRAFFTRIGFGMPFSGLVSLAAVGCILAVALMLDRRQLGGGLLRDLRLFAVILIMTTIGNSFTWPHHLVMLFPGYLAAAAATASSGSVISWLVIAASFLMATAHFPNMGNPPTHNPILLSLGLGGALVLVVLLLWESWQEVCAARKNRLMPGKS